MYLEKTEKDEFAAKYRKMEKNYTRMGIRPIKEEFL